MKRIRLTVDWDGPEAESTRAAVLTDEIESGDAFGDVRVSEVELVTDGGSQAIPVPRPIANPCG